MSLTVSLTAGSGFATMNLGNGEPVTVGRVKELVFKCLGVPVANQRVVFEQERGNGYQFRGNERIFIVAEESPPLPPSPEGKFFSELILFDQGRAAFPAFLGEKLHSLQALIQESPRIFFSNVERDSLAEPIKAVSDPLVRGFLEYALSDCSRGNSFEENIWRLYERYDSIHARSLREEEREFASSILKAIRGFQGFDQLQDRRAESLKKAIPLFFSGGALDSGAAQFFADRWRESDGNLDFRLFEVDNWDRSALTLIIQVLLQSRPIRFQITNGKGEAIDVQIDQDRRSCVVCAKSSMSPSLDHLVENLAKRFDFQVYYAVSSGVEQSIRVEVVENVKDPIAEDWLHRLQLGGDPNGTPILLTHDCIRLMHTSSGEWYLSFISSLNTAEGIIRKIEDPYLLSCLRNFPKKNQERLQLLLSSEAVFPHMKKMDISYLVCPSMSFQFAEQAAKQIDFHEQCKRRSESLRLAERERILLRMGKDTVHPFMIEGFLDGLGTKYAQLEYISRAELELKQQPPEDLQMESSTERMSRFLAELPF